jgi:plastocyanin
MRKATLTVALRALESLHQTSITITEKTMLRYSILAAAAALTLNLDGQTARSADSWGNLKGQFVYDGKAPAPKPILTDKEPLCAKHQVVDEGLVVNPKNNGIANIVVFVNTKKVKVNPEYAKTAKEKVVLNNHGCRFEPHILPIRVTQTLEIKNSDPFSHNSYVAPLGDSAENPLLSSDAVFEYHFHKQQNTPQPITCNIHPWMKAYVVVKDDPYIAVTDKDGNFEIKDLPAEELEFIVWHENRGYLPAKSGWGKKKPTFKMKIKKGDNDLGTIKVAPKLLEPKN